MSKRTRLDLGEDYSSSKKKPTDGCVRLASHLMSHVVVVVVAKQLATVSSLLRLARRLALGLGLNVIK